MPAQHPGVWTWTEVHPIWLLLLGGSQGGWGTTCLCILILFYSLGSSIMVVPLPSSRCLAEGSNRICSKSGASGLHSMVCTGLLQSIVQGGHSARGFRSTHCCTSLVCCSPRILPVVLLAECPMWGRGHASHVFPRPAFQVPSCAHSASHTHWPCPWPQNILNDCCAAALVFHHSLSEVIEPDSPSAEHASKPSEAFCTGVLSWAYDGEERGGGGGSKKCQIMKFPIPQSTTFVLLQYSHIPDPMDPLGTMLAHRS